MYGGSDDTQDKASRIRAFKREMRRRHIAGDVYAPATSIEEEENGIIKAQTGELLVPAKILDSSEYV